MGSALFLAAQTWLLDADIDLLPGLGLSAEAFPDAPPGRPVTSAAARPTECCVTLGGTRTGLRLDVDAVGGVYDRAASVLGAALGQASEPRRLDRAEWEQALSQDGLFFSFPGSVPAAALASWLAVEPSEELNLSVSRLGLLNEGGFAALLLQAADGTLTRFGTAVPFDLALLESVRGYPVNFAFEDPALPDTLDPDALLFPGTPELTFASVGPARDVAGLRDAMLRVAGMSSRTPNYPEDDGTTYVDGLRTLRVTAGGVHYANPETAAPDPIGLSYGDGPQDSYHIESARVFAAAAEAFLGQLRLPLAEAYTRSDGAYVVRFAYQLDGLPVSLDGAPGGTVVFQNGVLTQADFTLRYALSGGERAPLLPERQAAALAGKPGKRFGLCWFEQENGLLQPQWAVY
jgi:hypothetical protein